MTTKNEDSTLDEGTLSEDDVSTIEEGATRRGSTPKKKGGMTKTILAIVIGAIVVATGGYMFMGGSSAPAPKPAKVAKVENKKPVEAPSEEIAAPVAEEVAPTETTPAVDPVTGLPVETAAPVADLGAPQDGLLDPFANLDSTTVAPAGGIGTDVVIAAPSPTVPEPSVAVDPAPVIETTVAPAPVASSTSADFVAQISQAVTSALQPIVRRLDTMDSRLTTLERRRGDSTASSVDAPRSNAVAPRPVPRAAPKKKRPTPAAPVASKNSIEVLTPQPVVVTRVEEVKPKLTCQVSAVVQGSAWLKNADGSFQAYSVGDSLPDGQKISAITPDKGIQVGSKTWSCK